MANPSICFLTNTYPESDTSYRAIFVKKMALGLQHEGYQVSVVTPKIFRVSRSFEVQEGVKVYRFPFFARDRLLIEYKKIPYFKMILYYISGTMITFYVLLKNRCGLIHVHWAIPTGCIAILLGGLFKKPVVVTVHGSDFRIAIEHPGFLRRLFLYVCRRASRINCVSQRMTRELEGIGIPQERISTFPMGIDEAFLEVGRNRQRRTNGRPWTILSNRSLHSLYNVSLLIRAIPMVVEEEPNVRFLIAGDGPEHDVLEKEVRGLNLGGYVRFLGRIPNDQMVNLLAEADVYVSTSLADGTSVSLLEAMATGTFPVVTAIPSNLEWIVNGENGFVFDPGREEELAHRIIEAIRSPNLAEASRRENLRITEQKASWALTLARVKELYDGALRARTAAWHRDCN